LTRKKDENNSSSDILAGTEGGGPGERGEKRNKKDNDNNNKIALLNQLHSNVKEQLSNHVWEIKSYNPLKFLIAHSDYKQIIYATTNKESKNITDLSGIKNEFKETVYSLHLSSIVIGAIPIEVIFNKNPLGLYDHKYTIRFLTQSNDSFTIGPKTIDEMVTYLKDRCLIYMSTKAKDDLAIMISAFERNGQLIVKNDVDTPGFYFIEGTIKENQYSKGNNDNNNKNNHPKPTKDQTIKCCELLDNLQTKFKKKDVFPTLLKWSIIAPFDYILKQVHKTWIPWLYLYGWSNTGKTTLGEICCCIWNRYDDNDSIIPFTAVDTKARFGEVLSKGTYPIVINEVAQLNDDKHKDLMEMFKTAITDTIARKKYVNSSYTDIPSFSSCILTGNSIPPTDTGYRRRIIPIIFTEKDQYSVQEKEVFKKLFDGRIKNELHYLGDFTANYIMEHQELLLADKYKDWKEIAEIILLELYRSIQKHPPEWIHSFVKENQLEDSKEDTDLLFRSYLINKVNETYNKYYRNIEKIIIQNSDSTAEVLNLPFSSRLNFCLDNKLISYFNSAKIVNENNEDLTLIIVTSDLIHELKNKISQISSLNEIASIIDGFEYGQKRVGGKNVRAVNGTKHQY
jgi:hypothetical protein